MLLQYIASISQRFSILFNSENIIKWWSSFIAVIIIFIIAKVILIVLSKVIEKSFTPLKKIKNYRIKLQRAKTIIPLLQNICRYIIYFIATVMALKEFGIDTTAIIASAGVVGLAVGFGAQSLVKDFISGAFIFFEGTISVGDVITVGEHSGTVEAINLRNIHLRKFSGELRIIPNGDVNNFGNFNKGFTRAIVEVGVAYEQDVEVGIKALEEIADKWAKKNQDIVLESPTVQGIISLGSSELVLRVIIKVKPMTHWGAERELKRKIINEFSKKGIEIPFPRQVVYLKK